MIFAFFFSESTKGGQSLILISPCLSFPSCLEGALNDEIFDDRLCELIECGCMNKHMREDKKYSGKFVGVTNTGIVYTKTHCYQIHYPHANH